jgi:hypothetical protein
MQFVKLIFREAKIFFLCIGLFCICANAFATEYYVSPSGSASWSECTDIETPCSAETAMENAQAGDTIYFRGGIYVLPKITLSGCTARWKTGLIAPSHSGTEDNPISFMAYPGEIPFLDNSANKGQCNVIASFGTDGQDYIIWDGIHTKVELCVAHDGTPDGSGAGRGWGAQIHKSNHVIIRNCDIEGAPNGLSNNNCIRIEDASYHEVYNNKLHGSLGTFNSTGITSYSSSHGNIHHNSVYNNTQGLYDKAEGEYTNYHHNFFRDNVRGFSIATESGSISPNNIKCYQNVFINHSEDAIDLRGVLGAHDNYIYNNTFVNGKRGVYTHNSSLKNNNIFNNIFANNDGAVTYVASSTVSLSNYNTLYNTGKFNLGDWGGVYYDSLSDWQSSTGYDLQSNTNNPNFINSAGTNPEDYKRTSYPEDGRGGSDASVIGAYITGNEVIGYNSGEGVPPSSPPNFSANN